MAIQHEICGKYDDTRAIIRFYSDDGLQIRKVGTDEVYANGEAIDVEGIGYTYEELPLRAVRNLEEVRE